jgi:hypothetical protein
MSAETTGETTASVQSSNQRMPKIAQRVAATRTQLNDAQQKDKTAETATNEAILSESVNNRNEHDRFRPAKQDAAKAATKTTNTH